MFKRLLPTVWLLALSLPAAAAGQADLHCSTRVNDADMQVLECTFARDDLAAAYRALLQKLPPHDTALPQELPPGNRIYPADEAHRYVKWVSKNEVIVAEEGLGGNLRLNKATLRRENGRIAIHWLMSE